MLQLSPSVAGEAMGRNHPRRRSRAFKREFPHLVEVTVPRGSLGKRLDEMHAFHAERGIAEKITKIRWYFADPTTAAPFAIEFSGEFLTSPITANV